MKRHFIKSLKALCTGVMTLCVASFCFTSCYDDSALNERIEGVESQISALDEKIEAIKTQLQTLTARVDALYTLEFQVNDSNELQYSFDGGATWVSTGVTIHDKCTCVVPDPCTCKEVSLVDNGESVTITVGDQSFTIEKPKEIVFEIRAGKVYFESEGTQSIAIKSSGIDDITVISYPKGWYAEITPDGALEVTAPNFEDTQSTTNYEDWTEIPAKYPGEGYVKVHACSVDGKCMVGKLPVVVSAQPVNVKAYGGMAYFNATGTWPAHFYYGASPRESFESEVAPLLEGLNTYGYPDWNENVDENYENMASVTASIDDLLGAKVEQGKEYVVYAIIEDWAKTSYTMEDFIVSYYSEVNVTAVEDESQRTPYNVTATVEVTGADSYYAFAVPGNYASTEEDLLSYKENFVASFGQDSYTGPMGKLFTESYTGSVLDIAEGTTASMSGNYAPERKIFLLVLPIDGRPMDEYTVEDIWQFDFQTSPLSSGGSIDALAVPVEKYTVEQFSYESWSYETVEKIVNKNFQIAFEVNPSATTGWREFYYKWMDEETWGLYGSDDELLVDYLLDSWGMTPSDIKFPYYAVENVDPETTMHFVGFFVDENGKYGKLAKISDTTDKVENSDIVWNETVPTNLVDGVLKNESNLEVTLANSTDMPASQYKYVWTESSSWNRPFDGMTDAEVALAILSESNAQYLYTTVKAEELVDGKLVIPGHLYNSEYYLAILPYDAEGKPGKSAYMLSYSCQFALDYVETDPSKYVAEPTVVINMPTEDDIYVGDEYGDGAYCSYTLSTYTGEYSFYYSIFAEFTPVEGTEVAAAFVNADDYTAFADGDETTRASGLWQKSFGGSYYTYIFTEPFVSANRAFNQYAGRDVPNVCLAISWKDADGNFYYKEYPLQEEFQKLYNKMYALAYLDGKQWIYDWADMAAAYELENMPTVLDLGVTLDGYFYNAYSMEAMYGEEAAGVWMEYFGGTYTIVPTDATSGVISLSAPDPVTGELTSSASIEYSNLTKSTCTFNAPDFMINNVEATLSTEVIPVTPNGASMM